MKQINATDLLSVRCMKSDLLNQHNLGRTTLNKTLGMTGVLFKAFRLIIVGRDMARKLGKMVRTKNVAYCNETILQPNHLIQSLDCAVKINKRQNFKRFAHSNAASTLILLQYLQTIYLY